MMVAAEETGSGMLKGRVEAEIRPVTDLDPREII